MRIGIVGGGQLGRMFIQNALNYGHEIVTLDPDPEAPCSLISHEFICADRNDEEAVYQMGKTCDVVTIEIENVSVPALKRLEAEGVKVFPQPRILEMVKDKGVQKRFYEEHGLPTAPFALVESKEQIRQHLDLLPVMQKMRVGGYDGKGVTPIKTEADIPSGFDAPSVLEQWVDYALELAVLVARNENGEVTSFPVVEQVFNAEANLVDYLVSPARIKPEVEAEARALAEKLIAEIDMVGLLAVELFLTRDGRVLINEIAPRPHNSGHHTIEACYVSQFDVHMRSILNWPLGDTSLRTPAAMINLLGEKGFSGPVVYQGMDEAIATSGVYPHVYGKALTKPFRKMGHVTVVGSSSEEALEKAKRVKEGIKVIA
ncbi:MAG: 5-(carboxyamino)imidazole ribonucleotide synthase [Flavobacteriales bacterium]|nr:5-(carboxyamino)imidazole ribonucleotide synthase [Flavobacteriales bacterium]